MGRNKELNEQLINFKEIKINLSQNLRIARKLYGDKGMRVDDSAPKLGLEPHSLRRIESLKDSHYPSLEVLSGAIELYKQDPNFFWKDWKENQKTLDKELENRKANNIEDSD